MVGYRSKFLSSAHLTVLQLGCSHYGPLFPNCLTAVLKPLAFRMSLRRRGATNARMRARRANLTPARNEVIARQMPICLRVAESRDAAGHEHLPLTWDPSLGDAPACGFDTEKRPAKMQLARRLNGTFWCTCPGKGKIQHVLVTYSFFVAGRVAALAISRLPLPRACKEKPRRSGALPGRVGQVRLVGWSLRS